MDAQFSIQKVERQVFHAIENMGDTQFLINIQDGTIGHTIPNPESGETSIPILFHATDPWKFLSVPLVLKTPCHGNLKISS